MTILLGTKNNLAVFRSKYTTITPFFIYFNHYQIHTVLKAVPVMSSSESKLTILINRVTRILLPQFQNVKINYQQII